MMDNNKLAKIIQNYNQESLDEQIIGDPPGRVNNVVFSPNGDGLLAVLSEHNIQIYQTIFNNSSLHGISWVNMTTRAGNQLSHSLDNFELPKDGMNTVKFMEKLRSENGNSYIKSFQWLKVHEQNYAAQNNNIVIETPILTWLLSDGSLFIGKYVELCVGETFLHRSKKQTLKYKDFEILYEKDNYEDSDEDQSVNIIIDRIVAHYIYQISNYELLLVLIYDNDMIVLEILACSDYNSKLQRDYQQTLPINADKTSDNPEQFQTKYVNDILLFNTSATPSFDGNSLEELYLILNGQQEGILSVKLTFRRIGEYPSSSSNHSGQFFDYHLTKHRLDRQSEGLIVNQIAIPALDGEYSQYFTTQSPSLLLVCMTNMGTLLSKLIFEDGKTLKIDPIILIPKDNYTMNTAQLILPNTFSAKHINNNNSNNHQINHLSIFECSLDGHIYSTDINNINETNHLPLKYHRQLLTTSELNADSSQYPFQQTEGYYGINIDPLQCLIYLSHRIPANHDNSREVQLNRSMLLPRTSWSIHFNPEIPFNWIIDPQTASGLFLQLIDNNQLGSSSICSNNNDGNNPRIPCKSFAGLLLAVMKSLTYSARAFRYKEIPTLTNVMKGIPESIDENENDAMDVDEEDDEDLEEIEDIELEQEEQESNEDGQTPKKKKHTESSKKRKPTPRATSKNKQSTEGNDEVDVDEENYITDKNEKTSKGKKAVSKTTKKTKATKKSQQNDESDFEDGDDESLESDVNNNSNKKKTKASAGKKKKDTEEGALTSGASALFQCLREHLDPSIVEIAYLAIERRLLPILAVIGIILKARDYHVIDKNTNEYLDEKQILDRLLETTFDKKLNPGFDQDDHHRWEVTDRYCQEIILSDVEENHLLESNLLYMKQKNNELRFSHENSFNKESIVEHLKNRILPYQRYLQLTHLILRGLQRMYDLFDQSHPLSAQISRLILSVRSKLLVINSLKFLLRFLCMESRKDNWLELLSIHTIKSIRYHFQNLLDYQLQHQHQASAKRNIFFDIIQLVINELQTKHQSSQLLTTIQYMDICPFCESESIQVHFNHQLTSDVLSARCDICSGSGDSIAIDRCVYSMQLITSSSNRNGSNNATYQCSVCCTVIHQGMIRQILTDLTNIDLNTSINSESQIYRHEKSIHSNAFEMIRWKFCPFCMMRMKRVD